VTKPSFKWPIIALLAGVYVFGAAFVDAFIDTEEDRAEAAIFVVIAFFWVAGSLAVINRRINRLDEWKQERRLDWVLHRDLPPMPEASDDNR
jgi:hypothetical protein